MKTVKLGDVCDFKARANNRLLPYIGMEDIESNTGKFLGDTTPKAVKSSTSFFDDTCVLYGKLRPYLNKVYVPNFKGHCSTEFLAIRPDLTQLDRKYLWHFLLSPRTVDVLNGYTTGTRMPRADLNVLKNLEVFIPPLEEQRRVVKRLDAAFEKIDRAIELTEKNIENTDLLFRKLVNDAIKKSDGSPQVPMSKVCSFIRGPFGGSLKKQIFKSTGYAVYEQRHAIYDRFDNVRYFIDDEKYKEMSRFALHPGNLIMSCSGTMGKIAIVPEDAVPGIINQALLKLTPNDKSLSGAYLKLWMQSDMFQHALVVNSGGAAIKNVASVKILKEIEIPLPSVESQDNIVTEIDKLDKSEKTLTDKYGIKLRELKALKQSMLTQAFSDSGVN